MGHPTQQWSLTLDDCPGRCSHEHCVYFDEGGTFADLYPVGLEAALLGHGATFHTEDQDGETLRVELVGAPIALVSGRSGHTVLPFISRGE